MQSIYLNLKQIDFYNQNGYLVVEQAVGSELLARLQCQFADWVEESRNHASPYGETINHKPRFDLEPGHANQTPALRRVNAPVEISHDYYTAMSSSIMLDCVADLIGPNVKFHHSKINSKLPGSATAVKWHQDFAFTPHTNDDLVTALLMVDDVTEQNGPLEVIPGSHRGPIHELWHDEVFTGTIADSVRDEIQDQAVICTGSAGSVCLMHTRLLHGSRPNLSKNSRTLFICVYSAGDAVACSPSPMPNKYEGLTVQGKDQTTVRCIPYNIRLPEPPATASFFDQQAEHK